MVDFNALLDRKYAILGQQADADTMRANASANYDNARAAAMGPDNARQNALNKANISHLGAQNANLAAQGRASDAQAGLHNQQGSFLGNVMGGGGNAAPLGSAPGAAPSLGGMLSPTPIASQPTQPAPAPINFGQQYGHSFSGSVPPPAMSSNQPNNGDWSRTNAASPDAGVKSVQPSYKSKDPEGGGVSVYNKGTARVPGKGSPKKDTVKAVLAPGEAVLNAKAAEMAGRNNIASLNRKGATMMGMRPGKGNTPGHYACGTSKVGRYASGTANVRSNDQRDLLPPVQGGVMTAPGDPRANLPPVVGPTLSQGPLDAMPRIDHGPAVSTPAMPGWSPTSAPPPFRHPREAETMPPMPPVPQGRSMAQIEQQVGQGGQAFAPQRAWDQDFVDQHNAGAGSMPALGAPPMDAAIPQPPIMQPDLGVQRARSPGGFDAAFSAARKRAGGAGGMFSYGGRDFQTNLASEPFKAKPRRV